jgi:hypothetical protein
MKNINTESLTSLHSEITDSNKSLSRLLLRNNGSIKGIHFEALQAANNIENADLNKFYNGIPDDLNCKKFKESIMRLFFDYLLANFDCTLVLPATVSNIIRAHLDYIFNRRVITGVIEHSRITAWNLDSGKITLAYRPYYQIFKDWYSTGSVDIDEFKTDLIKLNLTSYD